MYDGMMVSRQTHGNAIHGLRLVEGTNTVCILSLWPLGSERHIMSRTDGRTKAHFAV